MFCATKICLSGLAAVTFLVCGNVRAEPQMHRGNVVSATANRLVFKDEKGAEQSFAIGRDVRVMIHGKPARLEDLQATMPVVVATDETGAVLTVATIDKTKRIAGMDSVDIPPVEQPSSPPPWRPILCFFSP